MLSFSNFGDNEHPKAKKVRDAVEILHREHPDLVRGRRDARRRGRSCRTSRKENFPTSRIQGDANVLIFPDLQSGNIAYKLVTHISKGEVIGPLLIGLKHPVNIVSFHCDVRDIVNMAAISAIAGGVGKEGARGELESWRKIDNQQLQHAPSHTRAAFGRPLSFLDNLYRAARLADFLPRQQRSDWGQTLCPSSFFPQLPSSPAQSLPASATLLPNGGDHVGEAIRGLESDEGCGSGGGVRGAAGVGLILFLVGNPFTVIPAGHVGVKDFFGSVSPGVLTPGIGMVMPFTRVVKMSIQTQELKEAADVPSKEGLILNLEVSLLFQLDPDQGRGHLQDGRAGLRRDHRGAPVPVGHPGDHGLLRGQGSLFRRAREDRRRDPRASSGASPSERGIIVQQVLLRKIGLPPVVANAIQEKLRREQEAEQMKFVLQKEQQEAERKRIEAQGIADFQKIVAAGISSQLLEWKGIEATEKLAAEPEHEDRGHREPEVGAAHHPVRREMISPWK